jgi:hypothetical protein
MDGTGNLNNQLKEWRKKMDVTNYVKAGFPFLFVESWEIKRAIETITIQKDSYNHFIWDAENGLRNVRDNKDVRKIVTMEEETIPLTDAVAIIHYCASELENKTLVILENYDFFLNSPETQQAMLNEMGRLKFKNICLCMVGASAKFPKALEKMITLIDFPLPSTDIFIEIAKDFCNKVKIECNEEAAKACAGLSYEEAEDAMALSIIENRKLTLDAILKMKRSMIRKSGFLDFFTPEHRENLGGLEIATEYLIKRLEAFTNPMSVKPKLRSVLLVGIPGCGKSLLAKIAASIFNCPGLWMDIGSLKSKYVGDSEANMRMVTKLIDAFGFCVVLLDEIEKAFAGAGSEMDSGVSAGLFGNFLTWMQESTGEKIIFGTANNLTALPPEFIRRWDVVFFVDFPNAKERKTIVEIQNKKWKAQIPTNDKFIKMIDGLTGSEIEQLAKDSHFDTIENALAELPKLKKTKATEVEKIKEYGKIFRHANRSDETEIIGRNIDLGEMSDLKGKIKRKILNK